MPNNHARATAIYGKHIHLLFINWNIPLEVVEILLGFVFENRLPKVPRCVPLRYGGMRFQTHGYVPWVHPTIYVPSIGLDIYVTTCSFDTYRTHRIYQDIIWVNYHHIYVKATSMELKLALKVLNKSNKLKIPITKLKNSEQIHLLIHTEFACSDTTEA
jgi:hypothetical protein